MPFILIGLSTLVVSTLILWRRSVEMRIVRWELYKLRDELRQLAYERPEILRSGVFCTLDLFLTVNTASLNDLSLWTILPTLRYADREKTSARQRDFETRLNQPKNAPMIPIYERTSVLVARHLAWRHLFLTIVAFVTLIGAWICYVCGHRLAKAIASGAVRPIVTGDAHVASGSVVAA